MRVEKENAVNEGPCDFITTASAENMVLEYFPLPKQLECPKCPVFFAGFATLRDDFWIEGRPSQDQGDWSNSPPTPGRPILVVVNPAQPVLKEVEGPAQDFP